MKNLHPKIAAIIAEINAEMAKQNGEDNFTKIARRHLHCADAYANLLKSELSEVAFYLDRASNLKRSMKELSKPNKKTKR